MASMSFFDDGEWFSIETDNYNNQSPGDAEDDHDPDASDDYPESDPYVPSEEEEESEENEPNEDVGDQPNASTSSGKRKRPPSGRPAKRFRQFWLEKPEQDLFKAQRLEEAPSEQVRSWLDTLDGKLLERRMEAASQKAFRVDVDFRSWAMQRDLDETLGHAPLKKIGPLRFPGIPIADEPVPIWSVNGCTVEDRYGVPLIYKTTKVFAHLFDEISDSVVQGGVEFSHNFPFGSISSREEYATIEDPLFANGQVHYTKWCSQGNQHKMPALTADTRLTSGIPLFRNFFRNDGVATALHMVNAIMERIDPDYVRSHRELKKTVLEGDKGYFLKQNPSAWPGIAIHYNQLQTKVHFDNKSLYSGFDVINPWGPFKECILVFPDLGISLPIEPGDVVFLRGAALRHWAKKWEGNGRMVLVPFVDRRLFGAERVARPCSFRRLYGSGYNDLRQKFPATELSDILKNARC